MTNHVFTSFLQSSWIVRYFYAANRVLQIEEILLAVSNFEICRLQVLNELTERFRILFHKMKEIWEIMLFLHFVRFSEIFREFYAANRVLRIAGLSFARFLFRIINFERWNIRREFVFFRGNRRNPKTSSFR